MKQAERLELLERQMILLSRRKRWYEYVWVWVNGIGVVVGVFSSVASLVLLFWPQVNINLDKSLNERDAFATRFAVVNGGNLSLHNVLFQCVANVSQRVSGNMTAPDPPVEELNAGDTMIRACGVRANNSPDNATLDATVTYSYPILGTRTLTVHFETRKDAHGVPQWFKATDITSGQTLIIAN